MEDNIATKKQPNLPSNYVTLAQLQERWIKEQQIKQKGKEQQEEQNQKKLDNEEAEPEHLSQPIRRNSNRKSYRRNLIGTNVEESKIVSVAVLEENEKSKEMKRKRWTKKKKKGEARAPEKEGEVAGSEAHALLVKNEKKNVRYERKREMRVEYGEKVEKVVEENNQTVEIEKEIGDLSIDKESEETNRKDKVINGGMKNKYRDCEQNQKKLHNEEIEPEHLSQPIRRNSSRNLVGTTVEESKAVSVAVLEENEKSEEMKRKGWTKKKKKKGAARTPEEEGEVAVSKAHALLVKNEKKNVRYERKREMLVEYREKVEKVVEENNRTVEIEKEIGDLSIDKESEKSNRKNKVINGRMRNNYRDCDGYDNRDDRDHRGYNDGGDRGNGQYSEGHWRYNSKNGWYGGGHRRFNGNEQRKGIDNGRVWVKKEEVADDGDMVGNQSSSGPLKE
ncbi:unnamed protein product [Dovyalis caffra]|uniref:Uncharacterized protein n=1 Tax=Dovyalis caffra TaxID=77055 RepID=A0AAV1S7L9_9ROSI|nr:unnamed protein product [Dovyalis caffra]